MAESSTSVLEPTSSILSGRTLNIRDLDEVVALLERHHYDKASYYVLGLRLLLSNNTLISIKQDHREEVDHCFKECLARWLRKADRVENPTIDTLIAALREIGKTAVAGDIEEERRINPLDPNTEPALSVALESGMAESSTSVLEPTSSILSGRTLNIEDLDQVVALLERHGYHYYYIKESYHRLGLRLKLFHTTLEKIRRDHEEVDRCFKECLASWLRKVDGVKNPTIDTLIAALRGIGENAVADGIEEERRINLLRPNTEPALSVAVESGMVESSTSVLEPTSSILSGRTLNIEDLDEVIALLERHGYCKASYYVLGLRLKLFHTRLGKIRRDYKLVDPCFTECLASWLHKADGVENPTIDTLIAALRGIGENAVAGDIEEERRINLLRPNTEPALSVAVESGMVESSTSVLEPTSSILSGRTLNIEDLDEVIALLERHEYKMYSKESYHELGLQLKLFYNTLENIRRDYGYERSGWVEPCFIECLAHWLLKVDDVETPTIDTLIAALIGIGENAVAHGINEERGRQIDISKWLKEGTVNLTVKRVQMLGPPGSGKTCSRRLLLNEDPPEEDNSTPIACRAVKATRISVEDDCMKEVDAKALLSRLACDLKEAAEKQKEAASRQKKAAAKQKKTPTQDHGTKSKEASPETIPTDSPETNATESAGATEKADVTESADAASDRHSNKFRRDIVKAIPKAKANLNCHWVYIVDSGGQTAFQELLPLFTRAASLNIITLNLSKGMDEKLDLQYRIDGKKISCDSNFSYTNIEFLVNALSSGAMLQLYHTSQSKEDDAATLQCPEYFVLGTHSDKVTKEKIAELNEKISVTSGFGSEEKGYRIIPAKLGEIIYPVNTMLKPGHARQEESKKLCDTLFIYDDASDDTIQLPVRWFAFEVTLLEKAGKKSCLKLDDVLSIGRSLEMTEDDTKKALQHLHNVTIILYYPQVLPDIVFVDPHPILDILSRLLALTYNIARKDLHLLIQPRPKLDTELENLRKRGIFAKSLLHKLKGDHELSKSNFMNLLLHLHIIIETQDGYFIPSALPPFGSTGSLPESDIIDPLLIVWCNPVLVPVPRGIFPLAVVNLMNFKQPIFHFPEASQKSRNYLRYRDAMSFRIKLHSEFIGTIHLIKKRWHIEVYFEGDAPKYCPLICEVVTEAINSSSVAINLKPDGHVLAFPCSNEDCYRVVKDEDKRKVECSCPIPPNISGQEKYWSWFHGTCIHQSPTEGPKALDISHIRNVLKFLRGDHFKDNWKELGLELGHKDSTLSDIEHSPSKGAALIACLVTWLKRADAVDECGGATYVSLANAVERLGQKAVTDDIRRKCQVDCSQDEINKIQAKESPQSKPVPAQDNCHIAEKEEKEKQLAEESRVRQRILNGKQRQVLSPSPQELKKAGSSCTWSYLVAFICIALLATVCTIVAYRTNNDKFQAVTNYYSGSVQSKVVNQYSANEFHAAKQAHFNDGQDSFSLSILDITDLQEIESSLTSALFDTSEWEKLGGKLGLYYNTLKIIKVNNRHDVEACLREMLVKWLEKADDASEATWSSLLNALEAINQKAVAEKIRRQLQEKATIAN